MACDNYLDFTLTKCPETFEISGGLEASTTYNWEFKGKFNNKYRGHGVTDADGLLTISVNDDEVLQQDFFQPFSNAWELRLYGIDDEGNELPFVFCSQYDFLVLLFETVLPVPDPNTAVISITCPDPEL